MENLKFAVLDMIRKVDTFIHTELINGKELRQENN